MRGRVESIRSFCELCFPIRKTATISEIERPKSRMPGHKFSETENYKTDLDADFTLTPEQIDFYQQNGYIRLKQVTKKAKARNFACFADLLRLVASALSQSETSVHACNTKFSMKTVCEPFELRKSP